MNYQSLKNNLFLILVQLKICRYIRMNAQMQTLSSQAIRINASNDFGKCTVQQYFIIAKGFIKQLLKEIKSCDMKILTSLSQSIDMCLSLAEFPINFNILKEPIQFLIFRQFSPPFSCKVVSCVERFCFSSEIEVNKIYFSALLSKELDMM